MWEHADVDSFIIADNNYTIGANYADIDPGFTTPPGNSQAIVDYVNNTWLNPTAEWVDWRVPSPVTFGADGLPVLSWPPAFDLSYENSSLRTAGTDGLPLGDLNWFPDQKAEFLANREAIVTSIRDSMINAQVVYDPTTMDNTPLIRQISSSIFSPVVPNQLHLVNYPNPFKGFTTIEFGLEQRSNVTLSVSNLVGQTVFELTQNGLPSGTHIYNFDASNLSNGAYIYKINATGANGQTYVASEKMIISN